MLPKKVPYRKCVACQEMMPKKTLIRIVRTPDAETNVDLTGKASGRGAYLCANLDCLLLAKKKNSLARALKTKISDQVYEQLERELSKNELKTNES